MDTEQLDLALSTLAGNARTWARLPVRRKVEYLTEIRRLLVEHADAWVQVAAEAKGFAPGSQLVGSEEWLAGPYPVASWLTDAITTLTRLDRGADLLEGFGVTTRPDGQVVVRVLPGNTYDSLLLSGYSIDLWMEPEVTEQTLRDTMAVFYRQSDPPGRLTAVLGAGNVNAIAPLDALYAMIADGDVAVLKLNPVNAYLRPVLEQILAPLVDDGFLVITEGCADVGEHLTRHPLVGAVHITGSGRTYDAIVWGTGEEGQRRRAAGTPLIDKPVRAELGGVGPTIVVPGPWSDADVAYQGEHLATQRLHSSGHTCVASQVLVVPRPWPTTPRLLDAVRRAMTEAEARRTYYPQADAWHERIRAVHPQAERLGCAVPRTFVPDIAPDSDSPAFREEFFGPVYVSTALTGRTPSEYLRNAVEFANERLYGTLGANLVVHPRTLRRMGAEIDSAVADLRYGGIGVNVWTALGFLAGRAAWGAFPGHTREDIQSGVGHVHNALLFARVQKTVASGPFHPFPRSVAAGELTLSPKPPWFLSNRTAATTARLFTLFAADPRPDRLPAIFASALRG
jgi:aldehyde dehydrogenase (NAD(P)+)